MEEIPQPQPEPEPTLEQMRPIRLRELLQQLDDVAAAGYTGSNGVTLQVRDQDMIRWTQVTTIILAFHPGTVEIRDINDDSHYVSEQEALQMMADVAAYGQQLLKRTWAVKNAVRDAESVEELEQITVGNK